VPVIGGLVADSFLGFHQGHHRRPGVLMMLGHSCSASRRCPSLLGPRPASPAAAVLLKPNVSTLAATSIAFRPALRDQGFNIYYMGVEIGAFHLAAELAWLRLHYGWSVAFSRPPSRCSSRSSRSLRSNTTCRGGREGERRRRRLAALPPSEVRSRVITLIAIFGSRSSLDRVLQIFYTFTFWGARQHGHDLVAGRRSRRSSRSA